MKKFSFIFVLLVIMTGCSSDILSKEEANNIAIKFATNYIEENNIKIAENKVIVIDSRRNNKMKKWDIYLVIEGNRNNEIKLSSPKWVSVSDNKKIKEYLLWE
ncbi:MAG: hypothetical protein ACQEXQ_29345 [Bacillota bacterium]